MRVIKWKSSDGKLAGVINVARVDTMESYEGVTLIHMGARQIILNASLSNVLAGMSSNKEVIVKS